MRTVTAQSVLDGVLRREGGANLDASTATAAEVARFFDYIADRLRTAWEFYPWLETFAIERRTFRPEWAEGTTYAEDDEVYFDGDEASGYFTPNADDLPAAGESPDTDPAKWTRLTSLRRLVEFEASGETAFEGCVAAWDADPDATASARKIEFTLAGDGVVIPPGECAPDVVWLKLVKKCEDFAATLWNSSTAYAAGARIYYATTGEVYKVVATTTAGDTPVGGAAAKFTKLDFPYILARAVKAGALADWQRADGRADQADAQESQFYRLLDEQKWKLVAVQGQRQRIRFNA